MRRTLIALVVLVLVPACSAQSDPYARLVERIEAGADCAELFELRNSMHPKNPRYAEAGQQLGNIGCFAATSTRTPPAGPTPEVVETSSTDSL